MKKKLTALLVALAAAPVGLWFLADREGARELAAMGESAREDMNRERARLGLLPRPVLEGTPREENAALLYPELLASVADAEVVSSLLDVFSAGRVGLPSTSALSPAAAATLERYRPTIARLREALRCTRCAWPPVGKENRPWVPWWARSNLLTLLAVDGEERVMKGDAQGGAERWLETIRAETDLEGSSLNQEDEALEYASSSLERLLVAPRGGPLDHARIARDLARLEPLLPTPRETLRRQGLRLVSIIDLFVADDPSGAKLFRECGPEADKHRPRIPLHAYLARSARELDLLYREAEGAVSVANRDERLARALEVEKQRELSSSWLVERWGPRRVFHHPADLVRTKLRLVQGAYALEAWRDGHGVYPEPGEVGLPLDPFTPAPGKPLAYAPSAARDHYELSSVGLPDRPEDVSTEEASYGESLTIAR